MHVKLNTVKQIEVNGATRRFQPGDWVSDQLVGKQTLLRWVADGSARLPEGAASLLPKGAGIVARGENIQAAQRFAAEPGVAVQAGEWELAFSKTCLLDIDHLNLRPALLIPGFHVLSTWQMAVPLCEYDILASNISTPEDRQRTAAVCCDELRIPVYDTRLMFVRRCETTDQLMTVFAQERADGGDDRLAFLRAVFTVRPLILALPYTWTRIDGKDKYEH